MFPMTTSPLDENSAASPKEWAQRFLDGFSVEMLPRHLPLLQEKIAPRLREGRRVYIALVDPNEIAAQVEMASALRRLGLEPVPHLPARFMGNVADLQFHVKRLVEEAGVEEFLMLGGGVPTPYGEFHSVMDMLQTGFFQEYGVKRVGFAGHVEGNKDISKSGDEAPLFDILKEKIDFIEAVGIEACLVTQFAFDMNAVLAWSQRLQAAGILLPIRVGFAGPAKLKTLLHYSLMCGVGPSIRVLRKQAKAVHRLLKVSTPDEVIDDLAGQVSQGTSAGGVIAPHFFPLGGIENTLNWLQARLHSATPESEIIPL